ncbi:MAG: hypothetical protein HY858_02285 [Candidatus Solibacter usitatus]|nr:hypothetical protein [Candidatus Solibacter usitatus]
MVKPGLRLIGAALLLCAAIPAQKKYAGPRPPKPDVPFLLHAGKLVELETGTAAESQDKDGTLYTVGGATSPARTPMSEPIFIFQAAKINPDRLSLYKMEVRGGSRVLLLPPPNKRKKDSARPLFLMVTPLAPGLFKVEVNEFIDNGEYCLSPEGSNQVFCFTTY